MKLRPRLLLLLCMLTFATLNAGAQGNVGRREVERGRGLSGSTVVGIGTLAAPEGPRGAPNPGAIRKDQYEDKDLQSLQDKMDERKWASEDTAWERACELGTRDAFVKYTARYPYGKHVAEANKRIIDIDVDNVLRNPHDKFPGLKRTSEEDSENSTIVIANCTGEVLRILYSGVESREVYIPVDGQVSLTVQNGDCKIAAIVSNPRVKPFAGTGTLEGGRYEVSFYINRGGPEMPSNGWMHRIP